VQRVETASARIKGNAVVRAWSTARVVAIACSSCRPFAGALPADVHYHAKCANDRAGGGSPVEPARLGLRLECGIFGESRTIGWRENNNTS
jgi:hypothetical protein